MDGTRGVARWAAHYARAAVFFCGPAAAGQTVLLSESFEAVAPPALPPGWTATQPAPSFVHSAGPGECGLGFPGSQSVGFNRAAANPPACDYDLGPAGGMAVLASPWVYLTGGDVEHRVAFFYRRSTTPGFVTEVPTVHVVDLVTGAPTLLGSLNKNTAQTEQASFTLPILLAGRKVRIEIKFPFDGVLDGFPGLYVDDFQIVTAQATCGVPGPPVACGGFSLLLGETSTQSVVGGPVKIVADSGSLNLLIVGTSMAYAPPPINFLPAPLGPYGLPGCCLRASFDVGIFNLAGLPEVTVPFGGLGTILFLQSITASGTVTNQLFVQL